MKKRAQNSYKSTAICKMHKARVKANNYFWPRMHSQLGAAESVGAAQ